MKKAMKELIEIRLEIKEVKNVIKLISISTYFSIFSNEEKRQEEIEIYKVDLKRLLKLEFTALENLQKSGKQSKNHN